MYKENNKSTYVICNGFKRDQYIENIARLINNGIKNTIPLLITLKNDLLQAEIKGNSKLEFVLLLKKNQNLSSILPGLELVIKHREFYKKIQENDKLN
jgi:arginine decarboxylase